MGDIVKTPDIKKLTEKVNKLEKDNIALRGLLNLLTERVTELEDGQAITALRGLTRCVTMEQIREALRRA